MLRDLNATNESHRENAVRQLAGKRVLITGITGMVGANLARALVTAGARVHGILRAQSSRWRIADIQNDVNLHFADLRDANAIALAVKGARPEAIFHLAAARALKTEGDRAETWEANVQGTKTLLDVTRSIDYERFILASSSMVCGKRDFALDEECSLQPSGFFAETKAAADIAAQHFARTSRKPVAILRLFSVYGDWESPSRLIPTAIFAALEGTPIRLTTPGFRRDLIFIDDVIEAMCLAARSSALQAGELLHIGTGIQTANEETIEIIEESCGKKIPITARDYPPRDSDTGHWVANPKKAFDLLGWTARHGVREGIRKTVDLMIANGEAYGHSFAAPSRSLYSNEAGVR